MPVTSKSKGPGVINKYQSQLKFIKEDIYGLQHLIQTVRQSVNDVGEPARRLHELSHKTLMEHKKTSSMGSI